MKRDRVGPLVLLLLISMLGAFVWATRNPHAPLLSRAADWPVVGPAVETFRAHYGVDEEQPTAPVEEEPGEYADVSPSAPVEHRVRGPRVWVNTGTVLRGAPDVDAEAVATVARIASVPVVEQRGEWYLVVYRDLAAWVDLPGYDEDDMPPMGSDPEPPRPLPGRVADAELLQIAVELLETEATTAGLAGYDLVTDHQDPVLLETLQKVAVKIEAFYSGRYGVSPVDRPRETIVLFSREAAYRRFQGRLDRIAGLPAAGIVSRGLVAVFVGSRESAEVAATFVHELAHLLSRRALGPALPPWLDEGIADDLAYSEISAGGVLDPRTLAGSWRDVGPTRIWFGGQASARELDRALVARRTIPIAELLQIEWEDFVDPSHRLHYPESAFFVRFLIESDPTLREGFRSYLRGIAAGESVSADELRRRLGRSAEDIEEGFRRWLPGELSRLTAPGDRNSGRARH